MSVLIIAIIIIINKTAAFLLRDDLGWTLVLAIDKKLRTGASQTLTKVDLH